MQRQNFKDGNEQTVFVNLCEISVSESKLRKIMRMDRAQIEQLRRDYETGRQMVRVVLRRCGDGYNVEDGRHRVIAAKLARVGFVEAIIVGGRGH